MGAKSGKGGGGKGGGGGGGAAAAKKGGGGALSIAGTPAGIRSLLDTEEARLLAQAEKSRSFGDYVDILARKGFNGEKMWMLPIGLWLANASQLPLLLESTS